MNLDTLTLTKGSHNGPDDGACLLEAASWLAGEPWSDSPRCVSPVLAAYGRALNDALPDDKRQQLKPLLPRLLNTAGDGLDETRRLIALDWLIRTQLPAWLRLVPALIERADQLAAAPRLDSQEAVAAIRSLVQETQTAARDAARAAAGAAAWAAAWTAAWTAAWAATRAAAGAAARDAARAAAWAAARDAAGAAAWAAARAVLDSTVSELQDNSIALFDRLIDACWET